MDDGRSDNRNLAVKPALIRVQIVSSSALCTIGAVGLLFFAIGTFGDSRLLSTIARGVLFLVSGSAFCLGGLLLIATIRTLTQTFVVNPNGLTIKRMFAPRVCKWTELESVRRSSLYGSLPNCFGLGAVYDTATLSFSNGVRISIGPDVNCREKLLSLAERKTLDFRFPKTLREIDGGKTIEFKSIEASSFGLHRLGRAMAWTSLHSVDCNSKQSVVISSLDGGTRFTLAVGKTDNILLLMRLIEEKTNARFKGVTDQKNGP